MLELRGYQKDSVQEIRGALSKYRRVLFQAQTGFGKCLGKNTPILMYDGTIKKVQDVEVGDVLMGDNNTPRTVVSTCQGKEKMYRIIPVKGEPFECNESHILSLQYTDREHNGNIVDISVRDYLNLSNNQKHLLKLYRRGVEFAERETAIDPWILGLWIADGSKTAASCQICVNTKDVEIMEKLSSYGAHKLKGTKEHREGKQCRTWSFGGMRGDGSPRVNSNPFREEFKKCIFDSHTDIGIPYEYKVNSRANRLSLLAGILDGDGFKHQGGYEICTKYPRLRDDILFLARSLGFSAYYSEKRVDISKLKLAKSDEIRTYFRITISGDMSVLPMVLARKRNGPRLINKDNLRVGFSVVDIGVGDYYGFEIFGDNRRFLLGDFTVTHNTVVFSYIAMASQKYNRKVLILSDRTEILTQNGGALVKFGMDVDYITPKHRKVPTKNIVVAMAQTMKRRVEKQEWLDYLKTVELLIVDECHNCTADFIHDLVNQKCFVLGCTATPKRYGHQKQLGEMYRAMVLGVTTQELIDLGYLCRCRLFSVVAPKLDIPIDQGIGDYNRKALAQVFEQRTLYQGVVKEWLRLTPHTKTICFCVSSQQAIETCREFEANGISARYVLSGDFEEDEEYSGKRQDIYDAFKRNEFEVLVNVNILTAGFDVPDVQTIIVDFATVSIARWRQAIGRGCRIADGKTEFTVLDCGENWKKHGGFADEYQWLLWHDTHTGGGVQGVKECPTDKEDINHKKGCGQLVPISCKVCPACGHIFLTEKYEYELYLEEVANTEKGTVRQFCAEKKREGWSFYRILLQVALANAENVKPAIIEAYLTFHPEKTREDANRFYFVWKKNSWEKHRHKVKPKQAKDDIGLFG